MLPLHLYDGMLKAKRKKKKSTDSKTPDGGKHRRHEGQHGTAQGTPDSIRKIERHPLSVSLDDVQRQGELALRDEEDKNRTHKDSKSKYGFHHHSKDQDNQARRKPSSLDDIEEGIDLSRVSKRRKWTVVICFFGFLLIILVIIILLFRLV